MNKYKRNSNNFIRFSRKPIKIKEKNSKNLKKIIVYFITFLSFWFLIMLIIFYIKFIMPLPDVRKLDNLNLAKSSIIYDRDWNELYKIYKENRTYISFDKISKNMINALIAWEDKTFLKNTWVDFRRMVWAIVYFIIWKTDKVEWTSTITQQLIRNTLIENRSSKETINDKIERKIKEVYLSYKLSSSLSKEKILELYLNKIDFWSNSYWIEQASKTFFGKSAKDLTILEASILASLPKWPTYYSPYTHADRVLWYVYFYKKWEKDQTKIISEKDKESNIEKVNLLTNYIKWFKSKKISSTSNVICWLEKKYHKNWVIDIDWDSCGVIEYNKLLDFLNSIRIEDEWNYIEYQTWRKDFILQRMLEDSYIDFTEYTNSIIKSIWYKFNKNVEKINAAHFVMYIKEYLEKKYWKEFITSGWLRIYTTIDPKLQAKAEELINSYWASNEKRFNAKNSALISLDNERWEILAMVWWRNYFNEEQDWNVNMITSKLQPWSSFKPFVYANAIDNSTIWSKTPIFDLKTKFPWWYSPSNFDWKFYWLMNVSTALNSSRNIPAIKMVYLWWWEKKLVEFTKKLWFTNIYDDWRYGWSIWLWTAEITPLEMASAFSVFANLWKKKEISPILKILDSKWLVVEEKKANEWEQVIDSSTAYIINHVLSDSSTRPSTWNKYITMGDRKSTAKTWTSTKQYEKNWKKIKLPRDLWTVWYTPQITTVVWAWNTDWKEVNMSWDWLNAAWPIRRDFMNFAHKDKEKRFWNKPGSVKEILISRLTWFPIQWWAWNLTDLSLFKNIPSWTGSWLKVIKVDALCNWKVTELTPNAAIKDIYVVDFDALLTYNEAWKDPVRIWVTSWGYKTMFWNIIDTSETIKNTPCDREENPDIWNIQIASRYSNKLSTWLNKIEFAYNSDSPIIKIDILLDDSKVDEIILPWKTKWSYAWNIKIPEEYSWVYDLTLRAVNKKYYSVNDTKQVEIISVSWNSTNISNTNNSNNSSSWSKNDKDNKENNNSTFSLKITNPSDWSIKLYPFQQFNLRWEVTSDENIESINIYVNWKLVKSWIKDKSFVYLLSTSGLVSWNHNIEVEVILSNWDKTNKRISLEIL